ncbi:MAG: flagellar motor switch protein FliM [Deltaproteobacteria bacterium]|nr:flagellar motor switch protein FliM [Deltaproteobacteria bacterium]
MARSVLSQDEIDAFLQGIDSGEVETGDSAPPASSRREPVDGPPVYDFTRSELSIHGQLPGLESIFNKFARRLRNIFVSELGKAVYIGLDTLEAVPYEDLIKRLPLPSSIHLVRLEPLRGQSIFVIEARLAYTMIDIFFGGNGLRVVNAEGREFTPIETSFLGKFVTKMLKGMEDAWQPLLQISSRYLGSEMNPYLLGATTMADVMVMGTFNIEISAQVSGEIICAVPLTTLEEVRDRLRSPFLLVREREDNSEMTNRLRAHLLDTEVNLRAVVDVVELSLREIVNLRPGDFIQLNSRGMEQASLLAERKPLFLGRGAQSNGTTVFVVSKRCH